MPTNSSVNPPVNTLANNDENTSPSHRGMDAVKLSLAAKKASALSGTVKIPGDKSMSHRALMFGALAEGETIISGLLEGEDVLHTAAAMRQLGARLYKDESGLWRVYGLGDKEMAQPDDTLDMGNSGTSTRLLMGVVAGHDVRVTFSGDASLSKRPMGRVIGPLSDMGAVFSSEEGGRLPLTVQGTASLKPLNYRLPVASAQVKSAILLAGLRAQGTTVVIESKPTRDHSENMLHHFGVNITTERDEKGDYVVSLAGGQSLKGCAVDVPADPSSAAFPVVAAALVEGSALRLPHVGINARRIGLYETLKDMGADIRFENERQEAGEAVADIVVRYNDTLKGVDVPAERVPSMIDEFPVLAVAASCAEGVTKMTGLAELRVKESDRLAVMARNLQACGVDLEEGEDSLVIHGTGQAPQGGITVDAELDHRIAMSFLVLGCVTVDPVVVDDASPINTSFPGFVDLMNDLGCDIEDVHL